MPESAISELLYKISINFPTSAQTMVQSSSRQHCRNGSSGLASNPFRSIQVLPGKTDTTNGSTEHCVGRYSTPSGSQQPNRRRPSLISGQNSTIISAHIKRSTCAHQSQKLYQKMAHNKGAVPDHIQWRWNVNNQRSFTVPRRFPGRWKLRFWKSDKSHLK